MRSIIIAALRECDTKQQIEKIFKDHDVEEFKCRNELLIEAMYSPYMMTNFKDEQIKYNTLIDIFLIKNWKLCELYKKAGL